MSYRPGRRIERAHRWLFARGELLSPGSLVLKIDVGAVMRGDRPVVRILAPVLRLAGAGACAGLISGGIGGRLAMRVVALVDSFRDSQLTADGNLVGEVTAGGTAFLLVFGAVAGVVLAFPYPVVRWIVGRQPLWSGLVYGLLLLMLFGPPFFSSDTVHRDFALFEPRWLGLGMFALLGPIYGMVLGVLAGERSLSGVPGARRWLAAGVAVTAVAALPRMAFALQSAWVWSF